MNSVIVVVKKIKTMCDCNSDCGGNCGGGCGGDCGQTPKIIEIEKNGSTQGTFYKGAKQECPIIPGFDVNDGESLTAVIQKLFAQICAVGNGGNYLAYSENEILVNFTNAGNQVDFDFPAGAVQAGHGIRIKMSAQFQSVTEAAGLVFKFSHKALETGGPAVADVIIDQYTIPQGTVAGRIVMDCTYFFNADGTAEVGYSFEVTDLDAGTATVGSGVKGVPFNTAPFDAVGVKFDIDLTGSDYVQCRYLSIEHLR